MGRAQMMGSSEEIATTLEWVAPHGSPTEDLPVSPELTTAIRAAIRGSGLDMQFQPIFQLGNWLVGDRRPVGYEALSRFESDVPTDAWFRAADQLGLGVELELAAVSAAVRRLDDVPAGRYITVNVSPKVVESLPFSAIVKRLTSGRVRLEISEEALIEDYERFRSTIAELRRRGLRVAIDDVGAGMASLKHLVLIPHDSIKLDLDVVRGVDHDRNRQAMVSALVALSKATGTQVVAEGIETMSELVSLAELGVAYGQGYFLGRPASLQKVDATQPPTGVAEETQNVMRSTVTFANRSPSRVGRPG
ncbi:MAG: EAL domain-containing protein [Acidimicrobiia bacterium]|nr:EAL domain-containing protein [Acidimicrobiia bacterium]MDH5503700.1 EAL domain-containing protein [Acidimicrobiia bacterium]